ncbi:MAG: hypothetical protein E7083_05690 [Bacteroidales bacterium]|nr:hypothetical protein [Bacteroidales bacterium]
MGYMIEITESKVDKLSEHIEQCLRHLGKAMQCVEEWQEKSHSRYGDRNESGRYRTSSAYGNRGSMGYRDEEDWEEMNERYEEMGERRRRDSRGRYM